MKTTTGSSHNVYPNADAKAPAANPSGAPSSQAAPSTGPQKTSFNVPRDPKQASNKAAGTNSRLAASSAGPTVPASQGATSAPSSPAAAVQRQAENDALTRAAKTGAVQDTVSSQTSKPVKASDPSGGIKPTPAPNTSQPSPGSRKPLRAKPVDPAKLGAEDLLQRLRYFENLNETQVQYIKQLQALVSRTGTAVPAMPHVKPFLSPAGNIDPNEMVVS